MLLVYCMHAFIIYGGAKEERVARIREELETLHIDPLDQIIITPEESTLGILRIRELISRIQLSPYRSTTTAAVIYDAGTLTIQAQNALLKLLEEPPPHAKLFLETGNSAVLLSTLLSRCQSIPITSQQPKAKNESIAQLLAINKNSIGEIAAMSDTISKNREDAGAWVDAALFSLHEVLASETETKKQKALAHIGRVLLDGRNQLRANVTPKLVIDNLLLKIAT